MAFGRIFGPVLRLGRSGARRRGDRGWLTAEVRAEWRGWPGRPAWCLPGAGVSSAANAVGETFP